jgi:hypothetical protein
MHQNLLNAGFASVWYINDNRENVKEGLVIKPLTKELPESIRDFAVHMPAIVSIKCILGFLSKNSCKCSFGGINLDFIQSFSDLL